jgi:hypothetical protein
MPPPKIKESAFSADVVKFARLLQRCRVLPGDRRRGRNLSRLSAPDYGRPTMIQISLAELEKKFGRKP